MENPLTEAQMAIFWTSLTEQWFESYAFYPKHGYIEYEPRYMMKVM